MGGATEPAFTHSGQATITVTSMHAKAPQMRSARQAIGSFPATVRKAAERLTDPQKWLLMLSRVFCQFLKGRTLGQERFFEVRDRIRETACLAILSDSYKSAWRIRLESGI